MPEPRPKEPSPVPLAAHDLLADAIHGEPVGGRMDAHYAVWKALQALTKAGWVISRPCRGCCNCAPSNFTDPMCNGDGQLDDNLLAKFHPDSEWLG